MVAEKLKLGDSGSIVTGFIDYEGEEIHPMDHLYQYSPDEGELITITATLSDRIENDEFGNPIIDSDIYDLI